MIWQILKQLSPSLSVTVADIYLASSRLGKYPPLVTSTSGDNCILYDLILFDCDIIITSDAGTNFLLKTILANLLFPPKMFFELRYFSLLLHHTKTLFLN